MATYSAELASISEPGHRRTALDGALYVGINASVRHGQRR